MVLNDFYGLYEEYQVEVHHGKPFFATERSFLPKIGSLVAELAPERNAVFRLHMIGERFLIAYMTDFTLTIPFINLPCTGLV